jgi:hypothetical protein
MSANRFGAAALLVSVPGWTPATERAECYGFVMAAWHRPDRELLPYLAEARKGLARLRVE